MTYTANDQPREDFKNPSVARDELISICETAFIPQRHWLNRDSASAQMQLGEAYALLRAGCAYKILTADNQDDIYSSARCHSNDDTYWAEFEIEGFSYHEMGMYQYETFYLPTRKRLGTVSGEDWY